MTAFLHQSLTGQTADRMILVAGENLVDLLVPADGTVDARDGGGPFNVARGIARLGVGTGFLGAISTDRFGRRLHEALAAEGVDLRWVMRTERPTTLALAELDDQGAAYRFYVEGTAAPSLDDTSAVPLPRALHVGSLGLLLEPMASALEALVARAHGRTLIMCDPNWRPAAIADPGAMRQRLRRVLRASDVVKVSVEDLSHLDPARTPLQAARALLGDRTRCVLVTDGAQPARALWAGGDLAVEPPAVDVIDTVGAGDATCAAFLAWWSRMGHGRAELADRTHLEAALAFAVHAAALTCGRRGADPPREHELAQPWRRRFAGASAQHRAKQDVRRGSFPPPHAG